MNMTTLILFGSFVLFLVLGLPVSISLGLSSLVSFFYCGIPIVTIAQRLYTGMDSFPLMAIPLFILAGNLMTAGGISRKIVDFANILTGRVRGGLAYTAILACAIFAALSGSGPATTIAIGAMIYPSMKEIKYPEAQSAGLMAVAGGLGPVIPPSIIMVIYSTLVGCSVTNMFSAGIFWGIFTVIVLAGVVFVISRKDKWPKAGVPEAHGPRAARRYRPHAARAGRAAHHPRRHLQRLLHPDGVRRHCLRGGVSDRPIRL